MSKVCIIGLDGGTFKVIDYLIGKNRLPIFAKLLNEGSRATLMSTIPTITPAAWSTFYTGMNPGSHGVVDFFKRIPESYEMAPVNGKVVQGEAIWKHASASGKRVCVFNVPVTYPATPVNGIMISGMDAPRLDEKAIYPQDYKEELLTAFPDFRIEPDVNPLYLIRHSSNPVEEYLHRIKAYLSLELNVIDHLMGLEDWDLFMAVFRSTDAFQHLCWNGVEQVIAGDKNSISYEDVKKAEAVFCCYEQIDKALGEIYERWGNNIIIMSDHGFCDLKREVCLNRILAENGLLKFKKQPASVRAKRRLFRFLAQRTPERSRQRISRMRKGKKADMWTGLSLIDWERTKIYSKSPCLYVNFAGREPLGVITSENERQSVLKQAEAALGSFNDPEDQEPIFTEFYYRDDLFRGPLIEDMPDMVIGMRNYSYRGISDTSAELVQKALIRPPLLAYKQLAHTGDHDREGILIMHGPDIEHIDLDTAEMVDMAPTIMNLLGLPAGDRWDGRILSNAFSGGKPKEVIPGNITGYIDQEHEDTENDVYSEEDEQDIRKRLQDLGYL